MQRRCASKVSQKTIEEGRRLRQEYYLVMRELTSQESINAESVIQYIIDGIPEGNNKVVLYGARDYSEFRTRLHLKRCRSGHLTAIKVA